MNVLVAILLIAIVYTLGEGGRAVCMWLWPQAWDRWDDWVKVVASLGVPVVAIAAIAGVVALNRSMNRLEASASRSASAAPRVGPKEPVEPEQSRSSVDVNGCEHCHEPFGEMASLGFSRGGYQCKSCGTRSCDKCGYRKGKAMGRATILCPACGSDLVQSFRL